MKPPHIDVCAIGPGGIKLHILLGGVNELHEQGMLDGKTRAFMGCSAGALISVLYLCGFTPPQIREIAMSYKQFLDAMEFSSIQEMIKNAGVFHPTKLANRLTDIMCMKYGLKTQPSLKDFTDLTGGRSLYVMSSELRGMKPQILGPETTPDMGVVEAVMASIRIPLVMQFYVWNNWTLVDGFLTCPAPLKEALSIARPHENIMGIFIGEKRPLFIPDTLRPTAVIPPTSPGAIEYLDRLYSVHTHSLRNEQVNHALALQELQEYQGLRSGQMHVLILPGMDCRLSATEEDKENMFNNGVEFARQYIESKWTSVNEDQHQSTVTDRKHASVLRGMELILNQIDSPESKDRVLRLLALVYEEVSSLALTTDGMASSSSSSSAKKPS